MVDTAIKQSGREWLSRADSVLPGGVLGTSQMPRTAQFIPVRAVGARLEDADGRQYLDYTMGSGALINGYAPPAVLDALHAQADRLIHAFAYLNTPAIELAELIVDALPSAERVRFTASGAEATAYAMRLARAHTGRDLVLKFEGAYHGFHDYAIHSFSSGRPAEYPKPIPDSAGIPQAVRNQVLVSPFNDLDMARQISRAHASDLAAIIVEPVQRVIEPVEGFLEGLRDLADEVGACLIFDEVVTAFRLGWGGAQERFGVLPDLTTLGKIIGGGLPLAGVCGRAEILDRCTPGYGDGYVYQSGTMNGHPLAAACGLATLLELRDNPPYSKLEALGSQLRTGLESACSDAGFDVQAVGVASLWMPVRSRHELRDVRDFWSADGAWLLRFHDGLIDNGIMVWRGNRSFISSAHTAKDIDLTIEVTRKVLSSMPG